MYLLCDPETLPNFLISSINFMVVSLEFSMCNIILSAKSESFTSSFPIWIPFVSISPLTPVPRTSKTVLDDGGESGHP